MLVAVLNCTCCGLINGILIARLTVYTGIGYFCTNWLSDRVISPTFYRVINGTLHGIPTSALFCSLLLVAASLAMRYTYWGQYIYAIGDNEQALRMIGVNTMHYQIVTYTCCGFFAGLSGVLMLARVSIATQAPIRRLYSKPLPRWLSAAFVFPGRMAGCPDC